MTPTDNKASYYAMGLFLVWPFLAAVSAFRNYKKSWAKNTFWAFCAFYGFAFAIGTESEGSDIVRYAGRVEYMHSLNMSFAEMIQYFSDSVQIDMLHIIIGLILAPFTGSQPVLTMVYGIVFGFFFSRNMWYVLERLEGKLLPATFILLTCFFLVNPIWSINGFRMWTATHIFLYGLLPYLCEGKKNGVWIAACSILVHFSFLVPVSVLLIYMMAGNRLALYYSFFIATFFISEIDIGTFNQFVENYLPEVFQDRSESYRREGQVEAFRDGAGGTNRWYAIWYRPALNWVLTGFLSVLFFKDRDFFESNRAWLNLFCFVLLFYGVANLFSSIPSGGRFLVLASLCALALIIIYIQNQPREKLMQWYIYASSPALFLYIIVSIRIALYSTSATTLLGNPIIAFFTAGENISLNDVMKMIF